MQILSGSMLKRGKDPQDFSRTRKITLSPKPTLPPLRTQIGLAKGNLAAKRQQFLCKVQVLEVILWVGMLATLATRVSDESEVQMAFCIPFNC